MSETLPLPSAQRLIRQRTSSNADLTAGRAEEDAHLARSNLAKELQFFERVKTKLRSRETYQDLLKCLNMFAQEITSRDEMLAMVNDLLGRMPELMARPQPCGYRP